MTKKTKNILFYTFVGLIAAAFVIGLIVDLSKDEPECQDNAEVAVIDSTLVSDAIIATSDSIVIDTTAVVADSAK